MTPVSFQHSEISPTHPWKIPLNLHRQFLKKIHFFVVSSQGMWAKYGKIIDFGMVNRLPFQNCYIFLVKFQQAMKVMAQKTTLGFTQNLRNIQKASILFLFSPLFGEDSHFDWYCSNGLKLPTGSFFISLITFLWRKSAGDPSAHLGLKPPIRKSSKTHWPCNILQDLDPSLHPRLQGVG